MKKWHIISFPRSGNHLVRAIIEFASHRPTLGCVASPSDTPIHSRLPNQKKGLISIFDSDPVGYKSHSLLDLREHEGNEKVCNILLITRAPEDAISSHVMRSLRKKLYVTDQALEELVRGNIQLYLHGLYSYRACPEEHRAHIWFEDILANPEDGRRAVLTLLERLFGKPVQLSGSDFAEIQELAKDSQKSLRSKRIKLKRRIYDSVCEKLTRRDVEGFLENGNWRS